MTLYIFRNARKGGSCWLRNMSSGPTREVRDGSKPVSLAVSKCLPVCARKPDSGVLSSDVAEGPKHLRSHPWANHAAIAGLEWRMPAFIHESGAETFKEHDMRQSVLMIMAAGAVTAFASFPAQAQYALCLPARGCIPTTQASYNACLMLARQRGWTDSDNAPRGGIPRALDSFIYQCLQGRIPR